MDIMILIILVFLGVSLLFYVLFGGADFGAGILELFVGKEQPDEQRQLISHAMAPVWEANHVWLILVVVILFMGFPPIYTLISTYLYLPILAVLIGIVARGCAFTFRHYDAGEKDFYKTYTVIFSLSSIWTSFFLGVIAGAVMLGRLSTDDMTFGGAYIFPWLNWFSFAVGLFTSALFTFLAAVNLIGEAKADSLRAVIQKKVKWTNVAVIIAGALVFLTAQLMNFPLIKIFFTNPISLGCFIFATILWFPFWKYLHTAGKTTLSRIFASIIVASVLVGWFAVRYPVAIETIQNGAPFSLTFEAVAAPPATLKALLAALLIGSLFIFPALGYLFKVFKWETIEKERKRNVD